MKFTWTRHGSLGDILATCNLIKNFREKYGLSSEIAYKLHPAPAKVIDSFLDKMGFKLLLNSMEPSNFGVEFPLIGYPIPQSKAKGNHPFEPMKKHLIEYWADELEVAPDFDSFILPLPERLLSVDYITVHVKAGWSMYKNWDFERWNEICWRLKKHCIKTIQIGAPTDPLIPNADGIVKVKPGLGQERTHFNTCLKMIAHAKLHIGVDSWPCHATNIQWEGKGRTKGVILWGSSQVTGTGYKTNVNISKNLKCQPCFREDPEVSSVPLSRCPNPPNQTYKNPKHECMNQITVDEVLEAVLKEL